MCEDINTISQRVAMLEAQITHYSNEIESLKESNSILIDAVDYLLNKECSCKKDQTPPKDSEYNNFIEKKPSESPCKKSISNVVEGKKNKTYYIIFE